MKFIRPKLLILLLILIIHQQRLNAQSDFVQYETQDSVSLVLNKPVRIIDPTKATLMAAAFPGLGQVYNKKYWKIPLVYAGFGALGYSIIRNSQYFDGYIKAYQDLTDDVSETNSYEKYTITAYDSEEIDPALGADNYDPVSNSWVKDWLLNRISFYRKYRDLSYIGVAVWYIVSILDANVDALLYDYDISPDLNVRLEPTPINTGYSKAFGIGLVVTF
ncbi:MAG: DUF5683 domain-containing protein [Kosmotogaceae bacterium]